jgi:hypothetical protein
MRRFRRGLLRIMVPLAVLALLGLATVLFVDQQSARARLAEAELQPAIDRATTAEARAVRAEASLTAIAVQQIAAAGATATAVSTANEPQRALERILARLFAVYQDPTAPGYDQMSDFFSPDALQIVRGEADFLRVSGTHLSGASTFNVDSSPPQQQAPDRAQVHTNERWLYDERDLADKRVRCILELSDQTYTLVLNSSQAWIVDSIQLGGTQHSGCPSGT